MGVGRLPLKLPMGLEGNSISLVGLILRERTWKDMLDKDLFGARKWCAAAVVIITP